MAPVLFLRPSPFDLLRVWTRVVVFKGGQWEGGVGLHEQWRGVDACWHGEWVPGTCQCACCVLSEHPRVYTTSAGSAGRVYVSGYIQICHARLRVLSVLGGKECPLLWAVCVYTTVQQHEWLLELCCSQHSWMVN